MIFNYIKWIYVKVEKEENTGCHHHSNRNLHMFCVCRAGYRSPILQKCSYTESVLLLSRMGSNIWDYLVQSMTIDDSTKMNSTVCWVCFGVSHCGGMSHGCQLSYRWPGTLPSSVSLFLSQIKQTPLMIGSQSHSCHGFLSKSFWHPGK